ncbi:trypsin-like peptidase domain-containing protein [Corynebacterium liangguodongii]|uniref:Serine protease n=1 Tax=Corynebacterium liangguodongii TaxID=2079535 RepID=A0A2S0WDZ2_9CORY|nr:trypsin-like peptidase domain-containing protein [Corynebacterium liangguodongii]AWB83997.1 serine protease [Corynebacterium liangguodongii]PWC00009.1 serine protease [Corynebacterium liangguodongii]
MRIHHVARIASHSGYCSGTLLNSRTVLTCAHFFRNARGVVNVYAAGSRRRVKDVDTIAGTDIALVDIAPIESADFPTLGPAPARLSGTVTFGYGGRCMSPEARQGRYLTGLPVAFSRGFTTRVSPAGVVLNTTPAVKGDSGGPVLAGGSIFAVQSLILDPLGINLGVATVSLLGEGVKAAVEQH